MKTQNYFFLSDVMCVSEKSYCFFFNRKQWPNLSMMYSILKLFIQYNLPNTTKCENEFFFSFLYSYSRFEYKIKKKWKVNTLLFETILALTNSCACCTWVFWSIYSYWFSSLVFSPIWGETILVGLGRKYPDPTNFLSTNPPN